MGANNFFRFLGCLFLACVVPYVILKVIGTGKLDDLGILGFSIVVTVSFMFYEWISRTTPS